MSPWEWSDLSWFEVVCRFLSLFGLRPVSSGLECSSDSMIELG